MGEQVMTAMEHTDPLTAVFAKRRDPGVLWGRTPAQLVVLLAAGVLAVMGINDVGGHRWWLWLGTVLLVAAAFVRFMGRPLATWCRR